MRISASAPGKLILLGEYAVLEGAPAIVSAINRYAKANLSSTKGKVYNLSSPTLGLKNLPFFFNKNNKIHFPEVNFSTPKSKLIFITKTLEQVYQQTSTIIKNIPLDIKVNTNPFYRDIGGNKFGLGSSAALTVSLLGALYTYGKVIDFADRRKIFNEALSVHFQSQGKRGSGIDIAASVFGGILRYQIYQNQNKQEWELKNMKIPAQLYIIPIWTGKSASTRKLLEKIEYFKKEKQKKYYDLIMRFRELCLAGCQYFERQDLPNFLQICLKYHETLYDLGKQSGANIISKEHQEIYKMIEKCDAVYKPSGAGEGDLGIALTASKNIAEKIKEEILYSDYEVINLNISKTGLTVKFYND